MDPRSILSITVLTTSHTHKQNVSVLFKNIILSRNVYEMYGKGHIKNMRVTSNIRGWAVQQGKEGNYSGDQRLKRSLLAK